MVDLTNVKKHMEVVGADGVHVGTVDKVEGDRIKLTKQDSGQGSHQGHHHYLPGGLVAAVEGDKVRLSATGANALLFEEEKDWSSGAKAGSNPDHTRSAFQDRAQPTNSGPDWSTIGLGLAAAGVAAGAAFLARSKAKAHDEFELRLQTDENVRLISSAKVQGTPVVGRNGEHLGKIENFMVDKYTGRVAYAVMSFGGTMGFGEALFPLPWSYLNYDVDKDGYILNITKEQLANAPKFKPSEAPEFDTRYRQNVARFYGRASI